MQHAENMWDLVDPELLSVFVAETNEQIENLVSILLQLEQEPQLQTAYINEMFRIAHNIKGSSGMVGMEDVKETVHELERPFWPGPGQAVSSGETEDRSFIPIHRCLKRLLPGKDERFFPRLWKERFQGLTTMAGQPARTSSPPSGRSTVGPQHAKKNGQ